MKSWILTRTPICIARMQYSHALSVSICIAILASLTANVAAQPHRVIATIAEDSDITIDELGRYLQQRPDLVYRFPRAEAHHIALDYLVGRRLKQYDFFERGYDQDPAFRQSVARIVTEELVLAYGRDRYENRYLNEERIRAEHELMARRVIYEELIVEKRAGMSPEDLRVLRQGVAQVQGVIEEGGTLHEAERQLRREMPSVTSRVREGSLTWHETIESPRSLLIFRSEPGEVRSFEGPNAISVVRIVRFEPRTQRPLQDVRDEIVEALQGWYAASATNAFREEWSSVIDVNSLQWNAAAIDQIVTWAGTAGFLSGDYRRTVTRHLAGNEDLTIVSDGMTSLQLSDLPRIFDNVLILSEGGRYTSELIREFILEAIRTEEIAARARAIGLEMDIMMPNTPSPLLATAILQFYNEKHLDPKIPSATDSRLRSFYEQHVDSLFYQLRAVNIQIIERDSRDEINSIWDEIQRGVRFEAASSRRLNRVYRRNHDGGVTSNLRGERPYFADIAFNLEPGEVVGPLTFETAEGETRYAVIKCLAQYEARRLRFDEVEDRVREEYLTYHREQIEQDLRGQLETKYGVRIYSDVLEAALNR